MSGMLWSRCRRHHQKGKESKHAGKDSERMLSLSFTTLNRYNKAC